jgi:CO dehydrogenase maturation factor
MGESHEAPLWFAVAGKGGAGKSVIAGTLARILARRGHRVLAIDSDPMPGLAQSLGVAEPALPPLLDAVEKVDKRWRLKKGIGPARAVARYTTEAPDGVRLLQLGKADGDGLPGGDVACVNAFLGVVRRFHEAPSLRSWTLVGDLPAGPRHPAAGFSPYASLYVVVVEPASQSALTACRIARFARAHRGAEVMLVANKTNGAVERRRLERLLGERVALVVPSDPAVTAAERAGVSPLDAAPGSPAMRAIERLADRLESRSLERT